MSDILFQKPKRQLHAFVPAARQTEPCSLLPDVGQRAQKIDEPFLHRVHMGELVCLHDIDGAVRRHYLNAYAWEILLHLAQSRQEQPPYSE